MRSWMICTTMPRLSAGSELMCSCSLRFSANVIGRSSTMAAAAAAAVAAADARPVPPRRDAPPRLPRRACGVWRGVGGAGWFE